MFVITVPVTFTISDDIDEGFFFELPIFGFKKVNRSFAHAFLRDEKNFVAALTVAKENNLT